MMKLRSTVVLIVLFWCAPALFPQGPATPDNTHSYLVSLIQVIANPGDFNGQHIKVVGFLGRGGGLDRAVGLFVSETDGRNFIVPNSIDLHVDESTVKGLMGRYVAVSGTYHAPAPRSGYNGYIDQVLDIKPLSAGASPK
jgi:hypothetical protein